MSDTIRNLAFIGAVELILRDCNWPARCL